MKIIGLTGGIGSGKSTIAKCLQIMGYPVYSADEEARRLTNSHPSIIEGLYKMFGEAIYVNGSRITSYNVCYTKLLRVWWKWYLTQKVGMVNKLRK